MLGKTENWGCSVSSMHRDIELNRIDDIITVIEPNRETSVGSHPYYAQLLTWIESTLN